MNIKQVEQTTGLTARQIREYEKIGLIPAITRTPSGYRDYSQDSIERLQFIKRARDVDFSLAEIKVLLAMQDNPCRNNSEVKALTAQHIVTLNEKIEQLQATTVCSSPVAVNLILPQWQPPSYCIMGNLINL